MENEIVLKLRGVLSAPIEREAEVVYLFVEIRKFLDRVNSKRSFPILRMFCDWVVHITLERYGKGSILESLDNALAVAGPKEQTNKALKEATDIFSFEPLRNDLRNFLGSESLPTALVDDYAQWGRLLKLYVGIVSECPLVFLDKKNYKFKCMRSATLVFPKISNTSESTDFVNIVWQWKLELRDGSRRTRSCTYAFSKGNSA
jgi:hypothetical protein